MGQIEYCSRLVAIKDLIQNQPKIYPSDPILFQQYSDLIVDPI